MGKSLCYVTLYSYGIGKMLGMQKDVPIDEHLIKEKNEGHIDTEMWQVLKKRTVNHNKTSTN